MVGLSAIEVVFGVSNSFITVNTKLCHCQSSSHMYAKYDPKISNWITFTSQKIALGMYVNALGLEK